MGGHTTLLAPLGYFLMYSKFTHECSASQLWFITAVITLHESIMNLNRTRARVALLTLYAYKLYMLRPGRLVQCTVTNNTIVNLSPYAHA